MPLSFSDLAPAQTFDERAQVLRSLPHEVLSQMAFSAFSKGDVPYMAAFVESGAMQAEEGADYERLSTVNEVLRRAAAGLLSRIGVNFRVEVDQAAASFDLGPDEVRWVDRAAALMLEAHGPLRKEIDDAMEGDGTLAHWVHVAAARNDVAWLENAKLRIEHFSDPDEENFTLNAEALGGLRHSISGPRSLNEAPSLLSPSVRVAPFFTALQLGHSDAALWIASDDRNQETLIACRGQSIGLDHMPEVADFTAHPIDVVKVAGELAKMSGVNGVFNAWASRPNPRLDPVLMGLGDRFFGASPTLIEEAVVNGHVGFVTQRMSAFELDNASLIALWQKPSNPSETNHQILRSIVLDPSDDEALQKRRENAVLAVMDEVGKRGVSKDCLAGSLDANVHEKLVKAQHDALVLRLMDWGLDPHRAPDFPGNSQAQSLMNLAKNFHPELVPKMASHEAHRKVMRVLGDLDLAALPTPRI